MERANQVVDGLLHVLVQIGGLLLSAILAIEVWIRGQLSQAGLPAAVQTVLMLAVAALLIVGSLRLFGGLIRVAVVLLLVLIALRIVLPVLPA